MAEQPSDIEMREMTEMIKLPSDNQTGETKMAEQSSDSETDETTRLIERPSDNEIGETSRTTEPSDDQIFEEILATARFQFAIKCLCTIMRRMNTNIVFSPHSIYEGLLWVYLASSDETEKQLRCKLELPDDDDIQKVITNWIIHRKKKRNEELPDYNDENSCWITNTKLVNSMTRCLFKNELKVVNFYKDYINLKNRINEYLKKKTEGYIRQSLELNNINKNMEIILSTVLCLKDDIVKRNTADKTHSLKKPRTVISPELRMIVTELPFANKNLSLFLLFPAFRYISTWLQSDKMSDLVERLMTKEGIDELRSVLDAEASSTEFTEKEKMIYPDFFEVEYKLNINKLLNKLGIENLLQPDQATLSNFTDQNLHFGDAIHHAHIKVTSENVIAGTVNMFFTKKKGSFNPSKHIDHSACKMKFLWLLYCKESHTILFIGSVNEKTPLSPIVKHKSLIDRIRQMFN